MKYSFGRHLGWRGDARYLPTYGSSSGNTCDFYGCYTIHNYLQRGSFTTGLIIKW